MKAVNNLVEKDELVAWSRMKEERREHTITKLLHTVEESALSLANNYKTPTELEIKATEMGEIIINTGLSNYIKLSCHLFPPVCKKVGFWIIVIFIFKFLDILDFFFSSTTELKLFTFNARHTKAKLSVTMGGDHINLTPKLRPEEDRNGKEAGSHVGNNYVTICVLGCTGSTVLLHVAMCHIQCV